jgi:hypothetical protein
MTCTTNRRRCDDTDDDNQPRRRPGPRRRRRPRANEYLNHAKGLLNWMKRLGRVAVNPLIFHSLNNSLKRAGVDVTLRMVLMRHSDARLTDETYLDRGGLQTAGLTDVLPR